MVLEWELRERVGKGSFGAVYRGCVRSVSLSLACSSRLPRHAAHAAQPAGAAAPRLRVRVSCARAPSGTARRSTRAAHLQRFSIFITCQRSAFHACLRRSAPPARSVNVSTGEEVAVKIIDLEEACAPLFPLSVPLRATHRQRPTLFGSRVRARALTHTLAPARSEDDVNEIQKEIAVLAQCRSPFVTRYIGTRSAHAHTENTHR
jgi:hypothetical protein